MTTVGRPGETLDGTDGGPGPASWPAGRRRQLRTFRRHQCIPDPARPGKRIHPSVACPHGTEGGYTNWGCECAWIPGTDPLVHEHPESDGRILVPLVRLFPGRGCEPVAVAAAHARNQRRRGATPGVTPALATTINVPNTQPLTQRPDPPATQSGRHRKPSTTG